jgi:hypothetical protein
VSRERPTTMPTSIHREWWLGMASITLALVLGLGLCVLVPAARLQYNAWRYRVNCDADGTSLRSVAYWVVTQHMERDAIIRLLGSPCEEDNGKKLVFVDPSAITNVSGNTAYEAGFGIVLYDGKAVKIEQRVNIPLGSLDIHRWGSSVAAHHRGLRPRDSVPAPRSVASSEAEEKAREDRAGSKKDGD